MKATLHLPGRLNQGDHRVRIELEPPELPWPVRFYFLRTKTGEWENVGFEMGVGVVTRATLEEGVELEPLKPSAARWFQANFFHYQSVAKTQLDTRVGIRRGGSANTPESRAALAAQYEQIKEQRGAIGHLQRSWNLDRSTIYRRLKQAAEEGLTEGPPQRRKRSAN